MEELLVPNLRPLTGARHGRPTAHGSVCQIPREHRAKPVIASLREPLDRLVSLYTFADWQKDILLPAPKAEILAKFPAMPHLTFKDFNAYCETYYENNRISVDGNLYNIGMQSADFLRFFVCDDNLGHLTLKFNSWEQISNAINRVLFLPMQNLNQSLASSLEDLGMSEHDTNFIRNRAPSNKSSKPADLTISEEIKKTIETKEWLLRKVYQVKTAQKHLSAESLSSESQDHFTPPPY